jgi:hypothetical protein
MQIDVSPLDALALYIKALHIYHSISQYVKTKASQSHHIASSSRLGLGSPSPLTLPLYLVC